jgi:hypothetical protein
MLLAAIISVITGAFAAWGLISVNNVRTIQNTKDITRIETELKAEVRNLDECKAERETVELIFGAIEEIKADIKEIKDGKDK